VGIVPGPVIRPAREDELRELGVIEQEADVLFVEIGMKDMAAADPEILLLDEPFAGVDPIAVQDIQTIVAQLRQKNIGILITDHNVYETLSITDRAYLLFEGKVLFEGTAEQLAENEIVREKYLGKDFQLRRRNFDHLG